MALSIQKQTACIVETEKICKKTKFQYNGLGGGELAVVVA